MPIHVLVRYRVSPDTVAANEEAVASFLADVRDADLEGVEYTSLRDGEVDFVHVGRFADEDAIKRFQAHPRFSEFTSGLRERAVDGPNAVRLKEIGSTRR